MIKLEYNNNLSSIVMLSLVKILWILDCRIENNGLGFILFYFAFILFLVLVSLLLLFILDLDRMCDVTSYVTVTQSGDIKKNIEGFRIDDII